MHDSGLRTAVGAAEREDLLLVQSPLVPYRGGNGLLARPATDDGHPASFRRYSPSRADRWIRAAIHVEGRPDRIFVTLYCHVEADANFRCLLEQDLEALFTDLEMRYNDGRGYRLHYLTARTMFNVIRATEIAADIPVAAAQNSSLKPASHAVDAQPDGLVKPVSEGQEPAAWRR